MPFQFCSLRERADALRRGGVDWADDIYDALDAVDDLEAADAALEEIGSLAGMIEPDASDLEAIKSAVVVLAEERDEAALQVKRLQRVIEALQAEQGRLVAAMLARGLVPPPPPRVTRPAVPPRRPGMPPPTLRDRMDIDEDDIPF